MKKTSVDKIFTREDLTEVIDRWRNFNETIAFTNGVFDILHRGHVHSLEKAASFADHLIVGVNSDRSAKTLGKGDDRPVNREDDRAAVVAGVGVVDAVVIFDEETPHELLSEICPDTLVKGSDYKIEEIVGREFAKRVARIELLDGYSTTKLIKRIRAAG